MRIQVLTIAQYLLAFGLLFGPSGCTTVTHDWEIAKRADTITAYEGFLQKHSGAELTNLAKIRLAELHADNDWNSTIRTNTIAAYEEFLQKHPDAQQVIQAKTRLIDLAFITDWSRALSKNTLDEYRIFIDKYPQADEARLAKLKMSELADSNNWREARSSGSIASLDEFIKTYPTSAYVEDAKRQRVKLEEEIDWKVAHKANSPTAIQEFLKRHPSSEFSKEATSRLQDEAWLFRNAMELVELELKPVRELFLEAIKDERTPTANEYEQAANEYRRVRHVLKKVRLNSHATRVKALYDGWERYLSEQAVCYDTSAKLAHKSEELPAFLGRSFSYFFTGNPLQVFDSVIFAINAVQLSMTGNEACLKATASLKNLNALDVAEYLNR